MRPFPVALFCATLMSAPACAQDSAGPSLFDQLDRLLDLFTERVAPKMEEGLQAMEPELRDLMARMQDMVQYHPPEILPNGDILIRRRAPIDTPAPPDHLPDKAPSAPAPFEL